jgi:hypothetical protein
MRYCLSLAVLAGLLTSATIAFSQSGTAPTPAAAAAPTNATTAAPAAPAPVNNSAAVPVPATKRFACQASAQELKGQERRDQMQLCLMQARLDCLKQAIDQKIVGPQRREFVRNCAE